MCVETLSSRLPKSKLSSAEAPLLPPAAVVVEEEAVVVAAEEEAAEEAAEEEAEEEEAEAEAAQEEQPSVGPGGNDVSAGDADADHPDEIDCEGEGEGEEACCVCGFDDEGEGDKIVFCDGCDLGFHQTCYGINEVPSGDFFCESCTGPLAPSRGGRGGSSSKARGKAPQQTQQTQQPVKGHSPYLRSCPLCPKRTGGFKRTHQAQLGGWAHAICVLIHEGPGCVLPSRLTLRCPCLAPPALQCSTRLALDHHVMSHPRAICSDFLLPPRLPGMPALA